jgi:hypothetical protein
MQPNIGIISGRDTPNVIAASHINTKLEASATDFSQLDTSVEPIKSDITPSMISQMETKGKVSTKKMAAQYYYYE